MSRDQVNKDQTKKVVMVYGNHGQAPTQLEDYFEYFDQIFSANGYQLIFSEEPITGCLNILVECFESGFTRAIETAKRTPGTNFIMVATEFITGDTFNKFSEDDKMWRLKKLVSTVKRACTSLLWLIFPRWLRYAAIDIFPDTYFFLKQIYKTAFKDDLYVGYRTGRYWSDRFKYFNEVLQYCNEIWCVSPHQVEEYEKKYGSRVKLLPIVSYGDSRDIELYKNEENEKDIDFLFTGSLTTYRKNIIDALKLEGFNVFVAPASLPSRLRDNYLSRAKICLHLKQTKNWRFPSIMRYHKLLAAGVFVIAEGSELTCHQEKFLSVIDTENFVGACKSQLREGHFRERGRRACKEYYEACDVYREKVSELIKETMSYEGSLPRIVTE